MKINFDEILSHRTDTELIKIVTEQRNDYPTEMVLSAEKELAKRKLSKQQIESAKQKPDNPGIVAYLIEFIRTAINFGSHIGGEDY